MSSPLTQLSLQPCSAAQLPINIKEEPKCSTPAPCQFSLKAASLQKHCLVSTNALTTTTTAPGVAVDKDRMLQEKDRQIEELTRMLRQKQRLVEVLRMQLEQGKNRGRVPEPLVLVRVKQEPPDKPSVPLTFGNPPLPRPSSSVSSEMDVTKVTVKQEAIEAEEVVSQMTTQLPDCHGLPKSCTQTQGTQMKPDQMSTQKKQPHICLQQTALQFAQQQAIQKLLPQQQHNIQNQRRMIQNCGQTLENHQKLAQQRKKKSHKQQLKQLQQQQLSKQHQQQMQLKQQILLKQQKTFLQQQNKKQHQQTKQLQQIQIRKQQTVQQQVPQVRNVFYRLIHSTQTSLSRFIL